MTCATWLLLWLWLVLLSDIAFADVAIRRSNSADATASELRVEGLSVQVLKAFQELPSEQREACFRLTVGTEIDLKLPSVLGRCTIEEDCVVFKPRFPFVAGTSYRAEFRLPSDDVRVSTVITIPEPLPSKPTRVVAIYPSASQLPQNLLRFYLHFSAPMEQGDVYRHVIVTRADATPLAVPFLEIAEELWDSSGKRLTLLLDPGRVKRGLVPREEDGAIFEVGQAYRLTVVSSWCDATGRELVANATKDFLVTKEDREQPKPAEWRLSVSSTSSEASNAVNSESPLATSFRRLEVDVPQPLDQALFGRCLHVFDAKGKLIDGETVVSENEQRWSFTPRVDWQPGEYRLHIDDILEDPAGNSIARPFEVDMSRSDDRLAPVTELRFSIP